MNWIESNYLNIVQWANNITKGDQLSEELAHYSIEKFMTNPRYEEIINRDSQEPEFGHCRGFILAIMRNSWYGAKSEFTRIHKAHRADIGKRKRNLTEEHFDRLTQTPIEEYDIETDRLIEAIEGLLEEMALDIEGKLWFDAKLFQMYLEDPNYSSLARKTDIPRMSISNAVSEARTYILQELKIRGII